MSTRRNHSLLGFLLVHGGGGDTGVPTLVAHPVVERRRPDRVKDQRLTGQGWVGPGHPTRGPGREPKEGTVGLRPTESAGVETLGTRMLVDHTGTDSPC